MGTTNTYWFAGCDVVPGCEDISQIIDYILTKFHIYKPKCSGSKQYGTLLKTWKTKMQSVTITEELNLIDWIDTIRAYFVCTAEYTINVFICFC